MHSVDRALMPIRPGERFPVQEKDQPVACRAAALRLRPLICNRLFRLGVVQEIAAGNETFPVPADPADNEYRNRRMRIAQRVDGARQRIADSAAIAAITSGSPLPLPEKPKFRNGRSSIRLSMAGNALPGRDAQPPCVMEEP